MVGVVPLFIIIPAILLLLFQRGDAPRNAVIDIVAAAAVVPALAANVPAATAAPLLMLPALL